MGLVIFDIMWCITMSSVWSGKPLHHEKMWRAFDNIRTITLILSVLNIFLRVSNIVTVSACVGGCSVFLVHDSEEQQVIDFFYI